MVADAELLNVDNHWYWFHLREDEEMGVDFIVTAFILRKRSYSNIGRE